MERLGFDFRTYERRFRQPLQTCYGKWRIREGILLRLTDETGQVGWGEIAPIPWFGSETLEQALEFCRQLPAEIILDTIFSIPDQLPACQFGFESAISYTPSPTFHPLLHSALLPTGKTALESWQRFWEQGYRTFKWKIRMAAEDEFRVFGQLLDSLPRDAKLRLDANAGLSYEDAQYWLGVCDDVNRDPACLSIEFLEQPLRSDQLDQMLMLTEQYSTKIALDETVATIARLQACYEKGWRGVYVIKPAIAGSPSRLRQFFQNHGIDAVFSSVFETNLGRQAGLCLAAELGNRDRATGYGTTHWFDDSEWVKGEGLQP